MTEGGAARKIAVLLQSLEGGGSQRRVVELVNGFAKAGREIDLVLVSSHGELRDRISSAVRLVELDERNARASLANYLEEEQPAALLAGAAAVHPLAVAAMNRKHRCVLILRASSHPFRFIPWSMPRRRLREYARRRLRMRRYAAANLVIAVSEDIAEAIRGALPNAQLVTIPNAIVTESFLAGAGRPIELPWADDRDVPLIVSIGRFALAKDFPTLLHAFALVRESRNARLIILGDGSPRERQTLLNLGQTLGIAQDFALPGPTEAVAAWLRRADLFVSSSLWEGLAGALIEALAMGCPVVATSAVGSACDLLRDGEIGRLVPPRNPRAMARAMLAELDTRRDPDLLRAAAAPYGKGDRAVDYLAAIDTCVSGLNPPSQ